MPKKTNSIPVNTWSSLFSEGVIISRTSFNGLDDTEDVGQSHRDDWHLFLLQEEGTTSIEIDFQKQEIKPLSVIYIHPSQVHRLIAFKNATISSWAINNEQLKPEYLTLLEQITPVQVLPLDEATFLMIAETVALGLRYSERKEALLYTSLLKDIGNALVALVVTQYLAQTKTPDKHARFEIITKDFKAILEHHFVTVKSPTEYAKMLHISTPYLNECVKHTTGYSVSHHIQQRIVLEAKRLLYHSPKTIKEIADALGYEDYSYFTRFFSKVAGMTPLAFRNKNLE